jgi:hypothetical protein
MTIPDPSSIPLAPDPLDSELDRSESELMAGEHASPQKTTTDREGHGKGSPGEPEPQASGIDKSPARTKYRVSGRRKAR